MKKTLCLLLVAAMVACSKSDSLQVTTSTDESNYPEFSWDVVPVCQHLNNPDDHFTEAEAEIIAKSSLICIEIQHARGAYKENYLIKNTSIAAQQIKKYNPNTKVLFYWHSTKDLGRYYQETQFITDENGRMGWVLEDVNGNIQQASSDPYEYTFDMSNSQVSSWWSNFVLQSIIETGIDGVFADGIGGYYADSNLTTFGDQKAYDLWESFIDALTFIKKYRDNNKLTIVNGYVDESSWNGDILPHTEGVMIEHFCALSGYEKDSIVTDIGKIQKCGQEGKIIIVKGWPRFTFLDVDDSESEYYKNNYNQAEYEQMCYEDITFPLACFLVAAGDYAYFHYGWGYSNTSGNLLPYPEFDMALGKPLAAAQQSGYIFTREFEHLTVWVDVESRVASILPNTQTNERVEFD